jgi:hypothetical protein
LINTGRLEARKIGDKTVIVAESIRRFIDRLPKIEPSLKKETVEAQ